MLLVALETEGMILLIPGLSSDVNHVDLIYANFLLKTIDEANGTIIFTNSKQLQNEIYWLIFNH